MNNMDSMTNEMFDKLHNSDEIVEDSPNLSTTDTDTEFATLKNKYETYWRDVQFKYTYKKIKDSKSRFQINAKDKTHRYTDINTRINVENYNIVNNFMKSIYGKVKNQYDEIVSSKITNKQKCELVNIIGDMIFTEDGDESETEFTDLSDLLNKIKPEFIDYDRIKELKKFGKKVIKVIIDLNEEYLKKLNFARKIYN